MTIGVYCVTIIPTGERYIGQSVNIENRWATHRYSANKKPNTRFLHKLKKYMDYIAYEILCECSEDELTIREQEWMDHFEALGCTLLNCIAAQKTANRVSKIHKKCPICSKDLYLTPSQYRRYVTCSKECGKISIRLKTKMRPSRAMSKEQRKINTKTARNKYKEKLRAQGLTSRGTIPKPKQDTRGEKNPNYRHGKYIKKGEM
jgi:endogenous inhibitor of DNA gyrase (YacG/DUF329 family)